MKLKLILGAILATLASVIGIFWSGKKAGANKVALAAEEEAREYEQAMTAQLITRLEKEDEELKKPVDTEKRDYFNEP